MSGNCGTAPKASLSTKVFATSTAPSTWHALSVCDMSTLSNTDSSILDKHEANTPHSVSLPELLAQTNMDQQSVSRLREEIGKFTMWLGKNCETYFVSEYETPSQEYIDKARSF